MGLFSHATSIYCVWAPKEADMKLIKGNDGGVSAVTLRWFHLCEHDPLWAGPPKQGYGRSHSKNEKKSD